MSSDLPIACTLSQAELREREQTVLSAFAGHIRKVQARPDGYVIEVAATDEGLAATMAVIHVEPHCCPFLRFDLAVEPASGPVHLIMTGGPGVREFLATWLEPHCPR